MVKNNLCTLSKICVNYEKKCLNCGHNTTRKQQIGIDYFKGIDISKDIKLNNIGFVIKVKNKNKFVGPKNSLHYTNFPRVFRNLSDLKKSYPSINKRDDLEVFEIDIILNKVEVE